MTDIDYEVAHGIACAELAKANAEISRLKDARKKDSAYIFKMSDQYEALDDKYDQLLDAMHKIDSWAKAYPLDIFPEPDLKKAAEILRANGITLDAISAHVARHVIEGVGKIASEALFTGEHGDK